MIASSPPSVALAKVYISEVFYDAPKSDAKQEWIELYNDGAPVDLIGWKLNTGSNHVLNVPPKNGGVGSLSIGSNAYLIVADNAAMFLSLHSSMTASVIDSAISIPNDGGTIQLLDKSGGVVDIVHFSKSAGAAGDGHSLNRSIESGTLTPGEQTPGAANVVAKVIAKPEPKAPASTAITKEVKAPIKTTMASVRAARTVQAAAAIEAVESQNAVVESVATTTAIPEAPQESQETWWWVAAGLLAAGAAVAAHLFEKKKKEEEWEIVEE